MSLPSSTPDGQPDDAEPARGARSGFVSAFARNVRRGSSSSPIGKVAVSGLVVVLTAGSVVGLGLLLNRPPKAAEVSPSAARAAGASSAATQRPPATRNGAAGGGVAPGGTAALPGGAVQQQAAGPGTVALGGTVAGGASQGGGATTGGATSQNGGTKPSTGSTTAGESSPSAAATTAKKSVTFAATAGLGCTSKGAGYGEYGWYENGDAGWWRLANGSYTGEDCDGRFTDMPMSGTTQDTQGQAIMWGFAPPAFSQMCTLRLFVPTSSSPRDVAAKRAHFAVVHGNTLSNTTYRNPSGDLFVNQGANENRWVTLGTFPVNNGQIGVKLTNRGTTSGYSMTQPHLAGGAVKIRCVRP